MTAVLHVSERVWAERPPILPIEGRDYKCPRCGASFSLPLGTSCPFHTPVRVPPVLSGRIAIAVDGAIVATATAEEVLPVTEALARFLPTLDLSPGQWVVTIEDWAPAERCPFGHDDPAIFRAEDIDSDAPLDGTRLAADIAATVPEANRDLRRAEWRAELKARTRARRKCRFCMFGEPVPVATAPVGTITTWEAG